MTVPADLDADELLDPMRHPVLDVEVAGRLLNLSRPSAYRAVASGQIPTIKMGRRLVVPTAQLRRMLGLDPVPAPAVPVQSRTTTRKRA